MKKLSLLFIILIMITSILSSCENKKDIISSSLPSKVTETVSSEKTEDSQSHKSDSSLSSAASKSSFTVSKKESVDSVWKITSYKDDSNSQGMFYTIYNQTDKTLIVVDGGSKQNADQVRNVIKNLGNHVTAWFLTHYHDDHIGAFNAIYPAPDGIKTDKIYASPIDYDLYMSTAQDWDAPEYYTEFLNITKNAENIEYLNKDDSFKIDGLDFYVLSAYNESFKDRGITDIQNNGSLVFKVSGKKNSMIFMGDFHSNKPALDLMEEYRTKLRADYIQLAHHGNSTTPDIFYELVNPSFAFFDAPEYQMTGQEYKNAERSKFLDSLGIKWASYSTAPNSVELK